MQSPTRCGVLLLLFLPTLHGSAMEYIIGIGGVTNGGKTTLTNRIVKALPNCCVIHQDDFFKPQDQIEVGEDGFKQWDVR